MDRKVPRSSESEDHRKEFVTSTSVGSILSIVFYEAFKSIIGFIALWFFKPVWNKIVEMWNSRKQKDIEESPKVDVDSIED